MTAPADEITLKQHSSYVEGYIAHITDTDRRRSKLDSEFYARGYRDAQLRRWPLYDIHLDGTAVVSVSVSVTVPSSYYLR